MDQILKRVSDAAWQDVCKALKNAGAVTQLDLASPASLNETSGQKLCSLIRHWGALYARMAVTRTVEVSDPCDNEDCTDEE